MAPSPALVWTDWPARRTPLRAGFAAAVIAAAVAAVGASEPTLAVVGGALLLGATSEVLLPTRYTVDAEGVETRNPLGARRRPWAQLAGWRRIGADFAVDGGGPAGLLRRRRAVVLRAPVDASAVEDQLLERLGPSAAPTAS